MWRIWRHLRSVGGLISTHTSRVGCDFIRDFPIFSHCLISTHTSRVGCDCPGCRRCANLAYFYSHIPCGMWRYNFHIITFLLQFLLTHPVWDVTISNPCSKLSFPISTHTSRVGCDDRQAEAHTADKNFYSHIPCGMWLYSCVYSAKNIVISTHTSRVGCDSHVFQFFQCFFYFYSHIPCGMWHSKDVPPCRSWHFYSHIPCGMWLVAGSAHCTGLSFLLTHPVWDVTILLLIREKIRHISTHTSRVGCDTAKVYKVQIN